jgi:hypothetical protein
LKFLALIFVIVAGVLGTVVVSRWEKKSKPLLEGILPVNIGVTTEALPNLIGGVGPSYRYFRSFVEAYLLAAGIPVAEAKEESAGGPFWQIDVQLSTAEEWTAYFVSFEWRERIVLARTGEKRWTSVWDMSNLGITNSYQVGDMVKSGMKGGLDTFIAEYFRVNPAVTARRPLRGDR